MVANGHDVAPSLPRLDERLLAVRRVLNDPQIPRARGYGVCGDEYESLAQWQTRALDAAGLLR